MAGGIVRGTGKRPRWARQAGQKDRLSKSQEGQAKQQSEKEHAKGTRFTDEKTKCRTTGRQAIPIVYFGLPTSYRLHFDIVHSSTVTILYKTIFY
jgi:hypothetical protein